LLYAASLLIGKQVQLGTPSATVPARVKEWEEPKESRRQNTTTKESKHIPQYHTVLAKIYEFGRNTTKSINISKPGVDCEVNL